MTPLSTVPARVRRLRLALALVLPLLAGCGTTSTNLITGEQQRGAYTWAQEVQIGREADPQIVQQFGLYEDAQLQAYVERVGRAVLQTSAYTDPSTSAEVRNTPFHFKILDSPVVNAMALPGGYIYVTRGLLAHVENEAQLAVVLGHEIGHVLGRHTSRRAASAQMGQLGLLGAAILGGVLGGGDVAQGILDYGGTGVQLLFLKYSRDDEREADRAGVAYSEFAGYDAAQGADFFRTLARIGAQEGGEIPGFLSTHPDPGEREQTIPQLAAQYNPGGTEVGREEYFNEVEGVVLGEDPRQGFAEGNTFYHPELRFRFDFPAGWRVANSPAAVQIGEPNGRAVLEFAFAQEQGSPQAAASTFAGQQGVQVADQQQVSVNGSPGYALSGTVNTDQGAIAYLAYFIEYSGNVYRYMGLTSSGAFNQYRESFSSALRSFQRLNDARYLNRQPVRLDVVSAPRTAAFSSFLSGRTMPVGMDASDLAILNGVQLNQQIQAGTLLKLPAD